MTPTNAQTTTPKVIIENQSEADNLTLSFNHGS